MSHQRKFPLIIIPNCTSVCFVIILITVLLDFHVFANSLYSISNDSKNLTHTADIFDTENVSNTEEVIDVKSGRKLSDTDLEDPLRVSVDVLSSTVDTSQAPQNKTEHWQHIYEVASWMPGKKKKSLDGRQVNLAIIPVLAFLFFLIYICLKICTWFRESYKEKELEMEYMEDYSILKHGDEEYMDVDLRSDSSVLYDTVSSYASFVRSGSNYNTWNSVRSVQVVPDMQALYKAFMMQRKGSSNSSKGLMKKSAALKDAEVQVDVTGRDARRSKAQDKVWHIDEKNPEIQSKITGSKSTGSEYMKLGSDFVCRGGSNVHTDSQSDDPHNAACHSENKSVPSGTDGDESSSCKNLKKQHRFKVSFVTDDCGNVISSSEPNSSSISTHLDSPNHSPSSILTHSALWCKSSEN